jgi:hypothetical protein
MAGNRARVSKYLFGRIQIPFTRRSPCAPILRDARIACGRFATNQAEAAFASFAAAVPDGAAMTPSLPSPR